MGEMDYMLPGYCQYHGIVNSEHDCAEAKVDTLQKQLEHTQMLLREANAVIVFQKKTKGNLK